MKLFSYLGITISGVVSENSCVNNEDCNLHAVCNDENKCECKPLAFLGYNLVATSTSTGVAGDCKYVHPNDPNVEMDVIVNDHVYCGEEGCQRPSTYTTRLYDKVYAPFAVYNTGVKVKTVREAGKMCSKLGMRVIEPKARSLPDEIPNPVQCDKYSLLYPDIDIWIGIIGGGRSVNNNYRHISLYQENNRNFSRNNMRAPQYIAANYGEFFYDSDYGQSDEWKANNTVTTKWITTNPNNLCWANKEPHMSK